VPGRRPPHDADDDGGRRRGGEPLLGSALPAGVVIAELFDDPPDVELYPEEAALVEHALDRRQREFATVRLCARTALRRLGVPPAPIVPVDGAPRWAARAPRWPDGVAGSMTHCAGYRAAAVARSASVASIGVDAEPNVPLGDGVEGYVLLPEERRAFQRLAAVRPDVAWDRLAFSAKESVYKAWYPLTGQWLDFTDCELDPDPDAGTFVAQLRKPGPVVDGVRVDRFTGWWRVGSAPVGQRLVATAVVVGRPAA
jgi:4'-phosphopantetheinyl transferase EntD